MYIGLFWINVSICVCMYLCARDRETEKEIRKRSVADRQAGSPVYPQDDQTSAPFPAVENQCWSRQDMKFIWVWWCRVYSHNCLSWCCLKVMDKEVMSHCCILCVVVQEWQTVTTSVSYHQQAEWQQDVVLGDPDNSQYQSSERLSKYSNGGQGEWLVTSGKAR